MIKVEGLTKRYARTVAVDNISFEVPKGHIVGFIGPNGAGKTTTMRVVTGFMPPTAGTVEVAGHNVLEEPLEVKKKVGYLPENPPLYPEMTVGAYLDFVGRLKGIPRKKIEDAVAAACERFELTSVRTKVIRQLSKGYRQRVGLAQAIIHNPDVLILDEPTNGLDPKQIIDARQLIRNLAGEHTVILSTHILPAVEWVCDEVIVIHQGKLAAQDSVQSLSRRLRGAEVMELEVAGVADQNTLRERLLRIEGVTAATLRRLEDGVYTAEVESAPGHSPNGALAQAVVDGGWSLHQMRTAKASLEDIYLELTGGQKERQMGGAFEEPSPAEMPPDRGSDEGAGA